MLDKHIFIKDFSILITISNHVFHDINVNIYRHLGFLKNGKYIRRKNPKTP